MKEVHIDLKGLAKMGRKSVSRAATFLGVGVKSVSVEGPIDYDLTSITSLRIAPAAKSDADYEAIKKAYKEWVISCGLRELIEGFSIFLDRIYDYCLLLELYQHKRLDPQSAAKKYKKFQFEGVEKKLAILQDQFAVETQKSIYFKSINQARNCITHRGSIVGAEDLTEGDTMTMNWLRMNIYVETSDGEKISITTPVPEGGIYIKDGGNLTLELTEKTLTFKKGEAIVLQPVDLNELCLMVQMSCDELCTSLHTYIVASGVEIKAEKQSTEVT